MKYKEREGDDQYRYTGMIPECEKLPSTVDEKKHVSAIGSAGGITGIQKDGSPGALYRVYNEDNGQEWNPGNVFIFYIVREINGRFDCIDDYVKYSEVHKDLILEAARAWRDFEEPNKKYAKQVLKVSRYGVEVIN